MFILKFNGFNSQNSDKNSIQFSSVGLKYQATVDYDETINKRIILMKDISNNIIKKNDCIIEMENLNAFIMQDFILFIQINRKIKGTLNFKNWVQSSSSSSEFLPQSYVIDIIHNKITIYFGQLHLIKGSGSNSTANKIELLRLTYSEKENQKLSLNDYENAINSLNLNMDYIESQNEKETIAKLKEKILEAINQIDKLKEELEICKENQTIILPEPIDFTETTSYAFSDSMQRSAFGNAVYLDRNIDNNKLYFDNLPKRDVSPDINAVLNTTYNTASPNNSSTNNPAIYKWWEEFENKINTKKENLIISESFYLNREFFTYINAGMPSVDFVNNVTSTMMYSIFRLYAFSVKEINKNEYELGFRYIGDAAHNSMSGLCAEYNLKDVTNFTKGTFTISNVKIKTDVIFKFDNVEKIDSQRKKRFIEFYYNPLNQPKIHGLPLSTTTGLTEVIFREFPKLYAILEDWIS